MKSPLRISGEQPKQNQHHPRPEEPEKYKKTPHTFTRFLSCKHSRYRATQPGSTQSPACDHLVKLGIHLANHALLLVEQD